MAGKLMTYGELMALPPETGEQGYRRGYCDGYIAALQEIAGNRPVNERLWHFWQNELTDWMRAAEDNSSKMVLPPTPPKK